VRAEAHLTVEHRDGRNVVRLLRSAAPVTLMPARGRTGPAVVRLVNSAATPLGGDDVTLTVHVGPCAALTLTGIAATVALPGPHGAPSRTTVRLHLAERATVVYLPEPTVITARANHHAALHADLAANACLRAREILVLGRAGELPGRLTTTTATTRAGHPVLRQQLTIGDPELDASVAHLAGKRVLATELRVDDSHPEPASGMWWSRTPLAAGGTLTTSLADDTVTALRHLALHTAAQSTC
jgi:urease accessory protein